MKNSTRCCTTLLICVSSLTVANAQETPVNASHTAINELEWTPTPFGPDASPVAGDFTEGQHITYIKFPAGMTTPIHTHSADYVGIVITGITRHWLPGKPETAKLLPVGSHWAIPAGVEHVSECMSGEECIMAIHQHAAFDFLPKSN